MQKINIDDIHIRTNIKPGDLGFIMFRLGDSYGKERNYNVTFEAYVGAGLSEFYENYNSNLDRVWICEYQNRTIGFLLAMHRPDNAVQLRYFYLERKFRGIGLGKKLLLLAIDFVNKEKYNSCYLLTSNDLHDAAILYKKVGFSLTEEYDSTRFGVLLKEQRYDLTVGFQKYLQTFNATSERDFCR